MAYGGRGILGLYVIEASMVRNLTNIQIDIVQKFSIAAKGN